MENKIMIIDVIENKQCKRFTYNGLSVEESLHIMKGYMETGKPIQVSWVTLSEHKELFRDYSDEILSQANITPSYYQ